MKLYDLWGAFQIPHVLELRQSSFELDPVYLPKQRITGELYVPRLKAERCLIKEGAHIFKGSRGWIRQAQRRPPHSSASQLYCLKTPHDPAYSLIPEALLQWLAAQELEAVQIHGAIPQVADIFEFAGETRFLMEYVEGISVLDALLTAPNPDQLWKGVLEQVCLLLAVLEARVGLDHRDLKADNLWLRQTPVSYTVSLEGHIYTLSAPFQVVLLDFGFACLGGEESAPGSSALVSLTDGLVPKIDPCPKPGRDLYYLLATTWTVPGLPERMGQHTRDEMKILLENSATSKGGGLAQLFQVMGPSLIYGIVNDTRFRVPSLRPLPLLRRLAGAPGSTVKIELAGKEAI